MGDEDDDDDEKEEAPDYSKMSPLRRAQRWMWLTLDDPSASKPAQYVSLFVMLTILLSILGMTFASIPLNMHWVNVWQDNVTKDVFLGSRSNDTCEGHYCVGNVTYWNTEHSPAGTPQLYCDEVDESRSPWREIEIFCISVFTAEYILRAWASPAGPGYLRYFLGPANLVDLVSIMPFYIELIAKGGNLEVLSVLRLIRLTRITRIFKMSKNFQGLVVLATTFRKSAAALLMLFLFMLIFSILFATLIYTVEGGDGGAFYDEYRRQYVREDGSLSPFESIPVAMWWTIVTMCTVGYGDQYPVTPWGKLVAVLTMFCGLVVLSLPITIIGANFNLEYRKATQQSQREAKEKRDAEQAEISTEMDSADAIQLIHELIEDSHNELRRKVMNALTKRENELRVQIRELLASYNKTIKEYTTPLEVPRDIELDSKPEPYHPKSLKTLEKAAFAQNSGDKRTDKTKEAAPS